MSLGDRTIWFASSITVNFHSCLISPIYPATSAKQSHKIPSTLEISVTFCIWGFRYETASTFLHMLLLFENIRISEIISDKQHLVNRTYSHHYLSPKSLARCFTSKCKYFVFLCATSGGLRAGVNCDRRRLEADSLRDHLRGSPCCEGRFDAFALTDFAEVLVLE